MQSAKITQLKKELEVIRPQLVQHALYTSLPTLQKLQVFTTYHVFAVWDFMSLLKCLQTQLTCTNIPWLPIGSANTRYLINEIVLGEESDVDDSGNRTSHFELYVKAMEEMGADTTLIKHFIEKLQTGNNIADALNDSRLPDSVKAFLNYTFDVIEKEPLHVQAAVFTFGREDLIPEMFIGMVKALSENYPEELKTFKYYLERHIEVDGDHHSHLAIEMVAELCGDNDLNWEQATRGAIKSLAFRKQLWDGILSKVL